MTAAASSSQLHPELIAAQRSIALAREGETLPVLQDEALRIAPLVASKLIVKSDAVDALCVAARNVGLYPRYRRVDVEHVIGMGLNGIPSLLPARGRAVDNSASANGGTLGDGAPIQQNLRADDETEHRHPHPGRKGAGLSLRWHGEADTSADRKWRVAGLLPETGVALLAGPWGVYKTFVALDLSLSVMTRETFAGRAVSGRCGVLFIAAEGAYEMPLRLQAA